MQSRQPDQSPRIKTLRTQLEGGNSSALQQFWEEVTRQGTPLVESVDGDSTTALVTFIWRGADDVRSVFVTGTLVRGERAMEHRMTRLEGTDVWYRTYRLGRDARFSYRLSPLPSSPDDWTNEIFRGARPDPLNMTPARIAELPDAPPQPWVKRIEGVPQGKVEKLQMKSAILNNERAVWIYTPPGYTPAGTPYGVLITFDGLNSIVSIPTPIILDNLISKGLIPPVVAIVLDNPSDEVRSRELPCYAPFAEFLATEVMPWIRKSYHVTNHPNQTVVAGQSYGGLAAAFAAFRHPEIFGNVISQSGTFAWKPDNDAEFEWLMRQFVASPRLPLTFYIEAGLLETVVRSGDRPTMLVANRHMRDVLQARGYAVRYHEFNGGHEEMNWRGTLADALIDLIGKGKATNHTNSTN